jgi:uncharacterized protein (DUF2384 family)
MRKIMAIGIAVLAVNLVPAGMWTAHRAQSRAREVAVEEGSITVRAAGVLNRTVDVYDSNRIAKAALDYELIEDHREALQNLGFSTVHIETATGETLDRPL